MKLYILNKLPTPYTDDLFRRLTAEPEVDLQVYHLWKGSWRRPWKTELGTGFPNKYMKVRFGADWEFLGRAWREKDAAFIIADWGTFKPRFSGGSIGSWSQRGDLDRHAAGNDQTCVSQTSNPQSVTALAFATRHDDLCPGKVAHDILVTMGVPSSNIVDLPFMVDIDYPLERQRDASVLSAASDIRRRVGCENGGLVFSMISTIYTSVKGQDIGIEAFAQCVKNHAGTVGPMGLLVVGEGPDRTAMESLVKKLGIEQRVSFLGWQEPAEMDAVYAATDVVLHPSRRDAYPLVVVEAMSWSKPVVGSDVCGSVIDRVEDGVNGYSFPSGNVTALARVLVELVNNSKRVSEMGANARRTAEEWPLSRAVQILKSNAKRALEQDQQKWSA